jgi:hypothetical protein
MQQRTVTWFEEVEPLDGFVADDALQSESLAVSLESAGITQASPCS